MGNIRIIGGELKSRKIFTARGMAIRPTSDRLRETLFNILSSKIRQAVVLDLFAGTGAFGIEALSRGANSAVFIDKSVESISIIERNIALCGLENQSQTIRWDIVKNLNCLKKFPPFTLVFMDPPYLMNMILPGLEHLRSSVCLDPSACIVVEHSIHESHIFSSDEANVHSPVQSFFKVYDQRKYGKTMVSFLMASPVS